MKRTWKDKTLKQINEIVKKNEHLRIPLLIYAFVISICYELCQRIMTNTKRLSSIAAIILIFIVTSSFAFPVFEESYQMEQHATEDGANMAMTVLNQDTYSYEPVDTDLSAEDILDDNDVLEGYDNQELDTLDNPTDGEQFSLDDILKENGDLSIQREDTTDDKQTSTLSASDWQLVLINKQHPVPDDYSFTLGNITGSMRCDVRIIDELLAMLQAAKEDGVNLIICSPYRDYNRQTVLFNRKIDSYMSMGYSYLEAYKIASQTVTVPGASEHQIGLAVDIISDTYSSLNTGFGETAAGIWLKEHGSEYGFILRYPLGKEYITGIQYEPWHFRYVGKEAATLIMNQGLTLEEFVEQLQ